MLIATLSIGDALVTLTKPMPLDRSELNSLDLPYHLTFTDLPTDNSYTKVIIGEDNAMQALAAWISADDREFRKAKEMLQVLRDDPHMRKHLP